MSKIVIEERGVPAHESMTGEADKQYKCLYCDEWDYDVDDQGKCYVCFMIDADNPTKQ